MMLSVIVMLVFGHGGAKFNLRIFRLFFILFFYLACLLKTTKLSPKRILGMYRAFKDLTSVQNVT